MNSRSHRKLSLVLGLLWLGTAACSESGVVAIRVDLNADFSGTVTASCLKAPEEASPLEAQTGGVQWAERANLYCSHGSFKSINALRFADITFAAGQTEIGMRYLRVILPRGNDVAWPLALAPSADERARAQKTFDPRGDLGRPGESVTIEIDLPGKPISHGVRPRERGVVSSSAKTRVTLVVPVDRAVKGQPLVWDVTWDESKK